MMVKLTVFPEKRIRFCQITSQYVGDGSVAVFHGHRFLGAGRIPDRGFDTKREAIDYLNEAAAEDSVLQWLPSVT